MLSIEYKYVSRCLLSLLEVEDVSLADITPTQSCNLLSISVNFGILEEELALVDLFISPPSHHVEVDLLDYQQQ